MTLRNMGCILAPSASMYSDVRPPPDGGMVYMAELRKSVFMTDLCAEAYTCYRPPQIPAGQFDGDVSAASAEIRKIGGGSRCGMKARWGLSNGLSTTLYFVNQTVLVA